jgi:multicomponent Na+:H+ antiporter subunit D
MFPFHAWLNTAYPTAPTPASAILSGVITSAGIFCVIRVVYFTAGEDFLRGTWVQYTWIILALITIIIGSVMACREKLLKKSLAYWTISQASHGMLGLAIMNNTAVNGALLHVIFQSVIITGLFLTSGAFSYKIGLQNSEDIQSIGRRMPITMFCFTLLSLALIGFPPMSGFMSKWYLALGALESNLGVLSWIAPAVLLLNTLLTASCLLQIIISGYFPKNNFSTNILPDTADPEKTMLIPIFILASGSVILGINASPIIDTLKSLIFL